MTVTLPEPPPPPAPAEPVPPGWEGLLEPGERILWQGRPDSRLVWADLLQVQTLFGLVFTGFALFWIASAARMGRGFGGGGPVDGVFPLFGLPFVAVGLYMVVGRIFWDAFVRRGLNYTLTDRTAFIAANLMGRRKLERYPVGPDMKLVLEEGTPGTVWFAEKVTHRPGGWTGSGSNRSYRGPSTTREPIGFRRIETPREVYRLLLDRIEALRAAAPQK